MGVVVLLLTVPKSCLISLERRHSNITLTEKIKQPLFPCMLCLLSWMQISDINHSRLLQLTACYLVCMARHSKSTEWFKVCTLQWRDMPWLPSWLTWAEGQTLRVCTWLVIFKWLQWKERLPFKCPSTTAAMSPRLRSEMLLDCSPNKHLNDTLKICKALILYAMTILSGHIVCLSSQNRIRICETDSTLIHTMCSYSKKTERLHSV